MYTCRPTCTLQYTIYIHIFLFNDDTGFVFAFLLDENSTRTCVFSLYNVSMYYVIFCVILCSVKWLKLFPSSLVCAPAVEEC